MRHLLRAQRRGRGAPAAVELAFGGYRRPALRILAAGGAALCLLLMPAAHRPPLRLVWNVSASVPVGLYRIAPERAPHRGDLVAVRPSPALSHYMAARRYVEAGALLVKPVAAVAGQRVCRTGTVITINGARVASALNADHARRPLPTWSGCRDLSDKSVFLLAPMIAASFDGRYFGPVPTSSIVGRAIPLWTRR